MHGRWQDHTSWLTTAQRVREKFGHDCAAPRLAGPRSQRNAARRRDGRRSAPRGAAAQRARRLGGRRDAAHALRLQPRRRDCDAVHVDVAGHRRSTRADCAGRLRREAAVADLPISHVARQPCGRRGAGVGGGGGRAGVAKGPAYCSSCGSSARRRATTPSSTGSRRRRRAAAPRRLRHPRRAAQRLPLGGRPPRDPTFRLTFFCANHGLLCVASRG